MYSQFSQYSSSGSGESYPHPYQQQQNVVTTTQQQQSGLTWNGTAWVSTIPTTVQPTHASSNTNNAYSFYSTTAAPSTTTHSVKNSNLISLYTQYYNEYTKLAHECQQHSSSQNDEQGRRAAWYQHYAHQASAAAHYYNGSAANTNTGPPQLPPAPPTLSNGAAPTTIPTAPSASSGIQTHNSHTVKPYSVTSSSSSATVARPAVVAAAETEIDQKDSTSDASPDSLQRFVHRCLLKCSSSQQEQSLMQEKIQLIIAQAIQTDTLHTTDWDAKPVILLSSPSVKGNNASGAVVSQDRKIKREWDSGSTRGGGAYYGPAATVESTPNAFTSSGATARPKRVKREWDTGGVAEGSKTTSSKIHYGDNYSQNAPDYSPRATIASGGGPMPTSYYGPSNSYGTATEHTINMEHTSNKKTKKKKKQKTTPSIKAKKMADRRIVSLDPNDDFVSLVRPSKKAKTEAFKGLKQSSAALLKRANRFSGPGGIQESSALLSSSRVNEDVAKYMGMGFIGGKTKQLDESDYEQMKVKGTCTTLEKDYLRLTAPPRAELVRPQSILKQHLQNLKNLWWKDDANDSSKRKDYEWFCSQLKSIRQDLTVQQIVDSFAVDVYETHARIALEEGDLNEYNQSQTQLRELYRTIPDSTHGNEFVAYRILYYVFLTGNKKYQEGSKDLFQIMLHLSANQQQDASIAHSLQVRVAVAEYDYHAFFRLYKESPTSHGVYLMNCMVPGVRQSALHRIAKAYRPSVETVFALAELGFGPDQLDDGRKYLESCGCSIEGESIMTKDSVIHESDLKDKKSSLI